MGTKEGGCRGGEGRKEGGGGGADVGGVGRLGKEERVEWAGGWDARFTVYRLSAVVERATGDVLLP